MGTVLHRIPDRGDRPCIPNEYKCFKDGISGQGQGLSQEEESKNYGMGTQDMRNKENGDFQSSEQQTGSQPQQRQLPGPIICWERFLPIRTLKVLLVENDGCTRQVVSALLRNCGYEVTATSNGLQAWKILEDLNNEIDLVLTEVDMPCLSGIGLLDKILSHKTRRNIPVIMMSSNDSMGTVFECLSKGSVDFLVKPVRKNELKNLWQHVWRRCHSSSGSGSESGIQTQKSVKSKSAHDSDNNNDSNDDDNGTSGLNARDGSDNGSGTQSSWTNRAMDVESLQHDQPAYPPDSTCALVIHPKRESFYEDWVQTDANKDHQEQELVDDLMGKDLEIGIPETQEMQSDLYLTEKVACKIADKNLGVHKAPEINQDNESDKGLESNSPYDEPSTLAIDLIGSIAKAPDTQPVNRVIQMPNCFTNIQGDIDKTAEVPSLESNLKRLRSVGESEAPTIGEQNVLRCSDRSAFKRCKK